MPGVLQAALVMVLLAAAPLRAQSPLAEASAGFGGAYRVGAWMPITVTVAADATAITGALLVDWDGIRYRQLLDLPAPSRRQFEFYVRADSPQDAVDVRLVDADGAQLDARRLPLRPFFPDEPLVVGTQAAAGAPSTIIVPAGALPRSWRGYDGVTDIVVETASIDAAQAAAVARWRARTTDADPDPLRRALAPPPGMAPATRARWRFLALYAAALAVASFFVPAFTRRVAIVTPVAAFVLIGIAVLAPHHAAFADAPSLVASTRLGAVGASGRWFLTVARAHASARGEHVVEGTADALLYSPSELPHEVRFTEDGRMRVAFALAAGEAGSVVAEGFLPDGAAPGPMPGIDAGGGQ